MKCGACGYKKGLEIFAYKEGEVILNTTKDEFIKINGHFTIDVEGNYGGIFSKEVQLYACPNCNTIQMNRW